MVHFYDPSTQEVEAGESEVQGHPRQHRESKFSLAPVYVHMHIYAHESKH